MKVKYITILLFFVAGLLGACKKEYLLDVEPDYEGVWRAASVTGESGIPLGNYIIIDGEYGEYGEWCELDPMGTNCSRFFSGEARLNRKATKVIIGDNINEVRFSIDTPPYINTDGDWECMLTSRIYIKD